MDDDAMDRLLSGNLSKLPSLPKRVVRLFISSTFTDMTLERNGMMERVYPRLKNYCRERHALDFQVVDMRWGVRDEATDDHQTVSLCSREIRNCQRVSLGPNFIALIGDKYGFRPLPSRIKSTEYRLLRRSLIESDINTDFLDTWYREDLNAQPAEYLLQPISSILKNFTNRNEPKLQAVDQRIWQAIQERLHELLLIGSGRLVRQGRLSERDQLLKYSISVTEREVLEGCLDVNNAKSHCLVFTRSIVDLRSHLAKCLDDMRALDDDRSANSLGAPNGSLGAGGAGAELRRDSATRKASLKIGEDTINLNTGGIQTAAGRRVERTRRLIGRYIDLTSAKGQWQADEEAQAALRELKEVKLASRLASSGRNLSAYQVHWSEQEGVGLTSDEHKSYLNDLTESCYTNLTRMIRNAVRSERSKVQTAGLVGEVLQHSHYALQASKSFFGRTEELDQIRTYILSGQHQQHRQLAHSNSGGPVLPMFLFGVSGSGKTSILALVASLAYGWIEQARRRRRSSVSSQPNEPLQARWKADAQGPRWDRKPCVIMRFCCTTPSSSSMVGMLTSVCKQLQYNFYQFGPLSGLIDQQQLQQQQQPRPASRADEHEQLAYQPIPGDFVRLVYTFRQLVENCRHQLHRRRLFLIILDSIERLSAPAESSVESKFSWLTSITRLPQNVRLIVSCSSTGESGARFAYVNLKRHFLQLHYGALSRANLGGPNGTEAEIGRGSGHSSGLNSGSDSELLELSGASTSSSSDEADEGVREQTRLSRGGTEGHSKYGRLLKRLILPAIRLKRGSRAGAATRKTATTFAAPQISSGRPSGSEWPLRSRSPSSFQFGSGAELEASEWTEPGQSGQARANYLGLLHARPLGKELAVSVLRRWLAESDRNLTQQQWAIVERSFSHCSRPIFVKLALGEVINWKSYSTQGDTKGLTFGSAWLAELHAERSGDDAGGLAMSECCRELLGLVRESEAARRSEEEENRFKWQMLAMEQQWLNYLDYRARREQQEAGAGESKGAAGDSGNVVIRVGGGAGHVTTSASGDQKRLGQRGSSAAGPSSMSVCHLSDTIEDAISQLLARIELQHGYLLTKHSLSYITAARNGICENELEDILSLDDVVLDDVFQYHLPPVRRIPPLLWTRIRNDLPDYLSERDADGIVITWHHDQFKTVTERRYLGERKQALYIHSLFADYFLGTWADKAKPFRCTRQQIQMAAEQLESAVQQTARDSTSQQQASVGAGTGSLMGARQTGGRLGSGSARPSAASISVRNRLRSSDQHDQRLQWMQAKAHRRVARQPLFYDAQAAQQASGAEPAVAGQNGTKASDFAVPGGSPDGANSSSLRPAKRVRYNLRKLTELPHHLLRSGRFNELASHVLFNYKWLITSIDALGLQSVFADLEEALEWLCARLRDCEQHALEALPPEIQQPTPAEQQLNDCAPSDELDAPAIRSMADQIELLGSTLRLSSSIIHSDPQMLAAQLIGRLVAVVDQMRGRLRQEAAAVAAADEVGKHREAPIPVLGQLPLLAKLIQQCDQEGASDCALLPTDHCLQAPDGLQLSSLEGHPFGVTSMVLAGERRHLLAASNRFIMWNISTGEIAREIDPKLDGAIMRELVMGLNNQLALAYTSDNLILALDILTQRVVRCDQLVGAPPIQGLKLLDLFGARRFLVWTASSWLVFRLEERRELLAASANQSSLDQDKSDCLSVSLEHEVEYMAQFPQLSGTSLSSVTLSELGAGLDLAYCLLNDSARDALRLATFQLHSGPESRGQFGSIELWQEEVEAASLVVSPSGRQIFYADAEGRIFVRRRRVGCWSRAKLIWSCGPSGPVGQLKRGAGAMLSSPVPLAVEIDGPNPELELAQRKQELSDKHLLQLANFERKIDRMLDEDEIESAGVFQAQPRTAEAAGSKPTCGAGVSVLKIYWASGITVLQLGRAAGEQDCRENCLQFPRGVRNVRLEQNRCQMMSVLVEDLRRPAEHFLVASATDKLLVYSVEREQLLRCIEAHGGRISKLLLIGRPSGGKELASQLLSVASSSLDKTVKIWNLSNIDKESRPLDRLPGGPIESMSVCNQRPLVACLSRGQLGVWDWRTMRLVARYKSSADFRQQTDESQHSPVVKCKFSPSGRFLAAATLESILLLALEDSSERPRAGRMARVAPSGATDWAAFKLVAECPLPVAGLVVGLEFLAQESRLLTILQVFTRSSGWQATPGAEASGESTVKEVSEDEAREAEAEAESESGAMDELRISSHALNDLRVQFGISCWVPKCRCSGQAKQQAPATKPPKPRGNKVDQLEQLRAQRTRLVALTRDRQYLVTVGAGSEAQAGSGADRPTGQRSRRQSSSASGRLGLVLNVHATQDGSLAKTIELRKLHSLERHESDLATVRSGGRSSPSLGDVAASRALGQELQVQPGAGRRQLPSGLAAASGARQDFVSVKGDQFNRLKALDNRDRQALVALIDDERGAGLIVDIATKQLVACATNWSGKSSSDGRYGLGRKPDSALSAPGATLASLPAAPAGSQLNSGDLRLLEMRRCRTLKTVLSAEQLGQLSSMDVFHSGGAQRDVLCGFTRPSDEYVFYCDSRARRLLLVRLRDSQLVANFKLSSSVDQIKCTNDGFALVLAQADGSLLTLAIADGQSSDSLARLAQYPSRRRLLS